VGLGGVAMSSVAGISVSDQSGTTGVLIQEQSTGGVLIQNTGTGAGQINIVNNATGAITVRGVTGSGDVDLTQNANANINVVVNATGSTGRINIINNATGPITVNGATGSGGVMIQNSGTDPNFSGIELLDFSGNGINIDASQADGPVTIYGGNNSVLMAASDFGAANLWTYVGGGINLFNNRNLGTPGASQIKIQNYDHGNMLITQGRQGVTGFAGGMQITNYATGSIQIQSTTGSGDIILDMTNASGYIRMTGLPTSNPGGTGRVWNNSGVLNIT